VAFDREAIDYRLPVDQYIGGVECALEADTVEPAV